MTSETRTAGAMTAADGAGGALGAADAAADGPGALPVPEGTRTAECCSAPGDDASRGYSTDRKGYLRRLKLIEGQVRGLQRMVESDTYCIDVLTQISAVSKALQSLALSLADDHIHHCVQHAAESGDEEEIQEKLDEVMLVVRRLLR